jgi:6-phosphogluconolactonase
MRQSATLPPTILLRDACVALFLLCTVGTTAMYAKTFVYVSNAQDGNIDAYSLDSATGALTSLGKTDAGKLVMPMAVSPSKTFLYAVVRTEPFKVVTYAIDPATGALAQKATAPLPDSMPYVSTDRTGRFLLTASYGGDKVAVSPIGTTGLVEASALQVIPTGRNAHAILVDRTNRFGFATNLGSDQILQFRFDADTGKLTANDPPLIKARAGHGPRHMAFSADNKYLYILGELSGHVAQFTLDQTNGTLTEVDSIASVPPEAGLVPGVPQAPVGATATVPPGAAVPPADDRPKIWAADIQITPNGKFLYSTERTTSKIALFSIAPETGKLTYLGNFPTEKQPRGIRIDPTGTYLVAAGEKSDRLEVFKIDQDSGKLAEVGRYPVGNGANWVEVVELP